MQSQHALQLNPGEGVFSGALAPSFDNGDSLQQPQLCVNPKSWLLDDGSLNPCFVNGVVQLIPAIVLLVIAPIAISHLRRRSVLQRRIYAWYEIGKLVFVTAQILILVSTALLSYWEIGFSVLFLSPAINAVALTLGLTIHTLEHGRTVVPDESMLFYWPLSFVVTFMKAYNLEVNNLDISTLHFWLVCSSLFVQIGILCLAYLIPKRLSRDEEKGAGVLDNADFYSKVWLMWMNPVIKESSNASLTLDTLPDIEEGLNTATYGEMFDGKWATRSSDSLWSFFIVLMRTFWPALTVCALVNTVLTFNGYVHPFLMQALIRFANSYWEDELKEQPMAVGFYIALAMFAATVFGAVLQCQVTLYTMRVTAGVKSALTNAIYVKSLKLSNNARSERTIGQIVNLMSVDVLTVNFAFVSVTSLWEAPLDFLLCYLSLTKLLGVSVNSIFIVMSVSMPLNWYITRVLKKMRKLQMQYSDQRVRLTTEILTNIKSLKLYSWEEALLKRLSHVRNDLQLGNLRRIVFVGSFLEVMWTIVPFGMSCLTFLAFVYLEDLPLTSDLVFPAMSLFNIVMGPVTEIPRLLQMFVDANISLGRIRDLLVSEEIQADGIERLPRTMQNGEVTVRVQDADFHWASDSDPILKDIDFSACKGELSCVVGRVGAGKTSFLRSLLGETFKSKGRVQVHGSVAYVSQDPWLMNNSVRENILFGNKYDPEFYKKTVFACALEQDFEILPDGDDTEIGERGVSLSGGQKARLSLARAVYARCDVYLMDDPLSAVDAHVGQHIIENVLSTSSGLLGSKTRVLCTNAISVLSQSQKIVLLENHVIGESGSYREVMRAKKSLYALIKEFGREHQQQEVLVEVSEGEQQQQVESASESELSEIGDSDTLASSIENIPVAAPVDVRARRDSVVSLRRASISSFGPRGPAGMRRKPKPQVVKKIRTAKKQEKSKVGRVQWNVYKRYIASCGQLSVIVAIGAMGLTNLMSLCTNLWLKRWVDANGKAGYNIQPSYWLGVYFLIGVLYAASGVGRRFACTVFCAMRASKILHDTMALSVVRSPMQFFETTPVGRIINRFTSDLSELDSGLPSSFIDVATSSIKFVLSLGVIFFSAPIILVVVLPLSVWYLYYHRLYQSSSRELKRLLSTSRSPIYAHFQEALNGISTIRAFDQDARFHYVHEANIDGNLRANFLYRSVNRWLTLRLQTIGAAMVLSSACTIVIGSAKRAFSPGLIGLMMMYTLDITSCMNWIVRAYVNLENSVVGVERILEFCDLDPEADTIVETNRPAAHWPHDGTISFNDYSTKYRPDLDPILKHVSFSIKSREKVGVVGRTGAGKTSLVMALFRIIEPTTGNIVVDQVDVTKIGLTDLRSKLSIIPQDSQVFEGTIRQNLDPFNLHDDTAIWRVLELSHLKDHVAENMGGLDSTLAEGGSNLSAGQRQLMCLGRALLSESSILVLDEATASVDVQTDKVVQETIRHEFKNKTIVTIAHRLNTIMDSDKIAVLDKGQVAEFDSPQNLLQNKDSLFYALCKQGGANLG